MRAVGSDFIICCCVGYKYEWGMYKAGGLCWVSTDICVAARTSGVSKGGCSLAGARPYVRGRHPSYWQKTVKKVYNLSLNLKENYTKTLNINQNYQIIEILRKIT